MLIVKYIDKIFSLQDILKKVSINVKFRATSVLLREKNQFNELHFFQTHSSAKEHGKKPPGFFLTFELTLHL